MHTTGLDIALALLVVEFFVEIVKTEAGLHAGGRSR
jgi:hypothetical protein